MKNISGKIIGFLLGVAGFLFAFKFMVLDRVAPSDELAPGVVVLISFLNGLLFAFFGGKIQNRLANNSVTLKKLRYPD